MLNPFIIKVLQKSRFRNAKSKLPFFKEIIFTKQWVFLAKAIRL